MTQRPRSSGQHTWIFTALFPALFIAPETINLGILYLRWDYLLIAVFFLKHAADLSTGARTRHRFNLSISPPQIVILFIFFSIYQLLALNGGESFVDGVKYAAWPLKIAAWGVGARLIYSELQCTPDHVRRFVRNLVFIVFLMQLLELFSPSFRDAIFNLYPVAATDRLLQLSYRARGPFNGYDVTSIFYVVSAVVLRELGRERHDRLHGQTAVTLLICLAGALIAARTGFLLLIAYYVYTFFFARPRPLKIFLLVVAFFTVQYWFNTHHFEAAGDVGLVQRYEEIVSAIQQGDLTDVSSVHGTFYMNDALTLDARDWLWGTGLVTGTTADQLYFKYLYMYGAVGLGLWILIHCALTISAAYRIGNPNTRGYARSAVLISVVFALAHVKGGNYFFAIRLGEVACLMFVLSSYKSTRVNARLIQSRGTEYQPQ